MASPLLAPPEFVALLTDVSVSHGGIPALAGVHVAIPAFGMTAIAGPNGSGKSTLLGVLAGVVPVGSGSVSRSGRLARGGIALVAQRSAVPDGLPLTVRDAVTMGRWAARGLWRPIGRADREIVDDALAALGLQGLASRSLGALSGGQRQRTLVAQGLAQRASVLLLDEPTAGVDDHARDLIVAALDDEVRRGTTIVQVTHDHNMIDRADRVIRLEAGRVVG
jgi:zinc/manganese transport system ATP-binding protein